MIIWGMVGNSHDASIAVFKDMELQALYTSQDKVHSDELVAKACHTNMAGPDLVVWYEKPYKKAIRQLYAGQPKPFARNRVKKYIKKLGISAPIKYVSHHRAHAAHYYNSWFTDATVIVIDSIGEWDTTTIWKAKDNTLKKKYSARYPDSLGLFYSSMTKRCGLVPQKDESKLDDWGGYVDPIVKSLMERDFIFPHKWKPIFNINMHRGIGNWSPGFEPDEIAPAAQAVFEDMVMKISDYAQSKLPSKNLVLSGGCAFNKSIRPKLDEKWDNVYYPPNPGDAGSAETCVLAYLRNLQ